MRRIYRLAAFYQVFFVHHLCAMAPGLFTSVSPHPVRSTPQPERFTCDGEGPRPRQPTGAPERVPRRADFQAAARPAGRRSPHARARVLPKPRGIVPAPTLRIAQEWIVQNVASGGYCEPIGCAASGRCRPAWFACGTSVNGCAPAMPRSEHVIPRWGHALPRPGKAIPRPGKGVSRRRHAVSLRGNAVSRADDGWTPPCPGSLPLPEVPERVLGRRSNCRDGRTASPAAGLLRRRLPRTRPSDRAGSAGRWRGAASVGRGRKTSPQAPERGSVRHGRFPICLAFRLTESRSGARVCDPQHKNDSQPDRHGSGPAHFCPACLKPSCLIAHTIKGKGVSFMENQLAWHYKSPNAAQLEQALNELSRGA